jgi:hypothetical protein
MIRIVVEVGSGAARFRTPVRAESIERAVVTTRAQYPDGEVNVLFPIDPEIFFGEDAGPMMEHFHLKMLN